MKETAMPMINKNIIKNTLLLLIYLLTAPPVLAAVKDTAHGSLNNMAWDVFYNILCAAGGGMVQVARNWNSARKYSDNRLVELTLSLFVSSFAGLLTFLFFAGTHFITISGITLLFFSGTAGVLGYEAIKMYTDDFKKTVSKVDHHD